jgi:hypothetical protein
MITTIDEAVFTLSKLGAIAPFWKPELNGEAVTLLESTARVVSGQKVYRVYSAAALLLANIPDLWLIKRHDRTELNSPKQIIDALNLRQGLDDRQLGIAADDSGSTSADNNGRYYTNLGTVSVRGRVVG